MVVQEEAIVVDLADLYVESMMKSHKLGPNPHESYTATKKYVKGISTAFSILLALFIIFYIIVFLSSVIKFDYVDPLDLLDGKVVESKSEVFDLFWYIGIIVAILISSKKFKVF